MRKAFINVEVCINTDTINLRLAKVDKSGIITAINSFRFPTRTLKTTFNINKKTLQLVPK